MKTRLQTTFLLLCLFACFLTNGQGRVYVPASRDTLNYTFSTRIALQLNEELASLPSSLSSGEKESCKKIYRERNKYLEDALAEGNFLFGSDLQKHVEKLFKIIIESNPSLPKDLNVVVADYSEPNAFSIGQKTIIVNLGLLYRMRNEAELTWILCHEIAHEQLHHVNERIFKYSKIYNDKERNKKIKEISKQMYGVHKQLKDLIIPELLDMMKNSRKDELQADSLGTAYYLNTPFSVTEPVQTLLALDAFDSEKDTSLYDLKQFFNSNEFPFQDHWITYKGASSLGGAFEETHDVLDDSLKTHPDCKLRSEVVSKQIEQSAPDKSKSLLITDTASFIRLTYSSYAELINSYSMRMNYGRSIFLSMEMQRTFPRDPYAGLTIARSLSKLYIGLKFHYSYVSLKRTKEYFSENYNRVLSFLNELRTSEIGSLAHSYYLKTVPELSLTDEELLFTGILANYAKNNKEDFEFLKKNYISTFTKGRYIKELNNLKFETTDNTDKKK